MTRLLRESQLGVGNGDEERPAIALLKCGERQRSPAEYTVILGRYDIELVRFPLRVISSEREGTGASCAIDASNGQLCVPARESLLTGRYPSVHRVLQNSTAEHVVTTSNLVATLHQAGYRVDLSGKNHSHLSAREFDHYAASMHTGSVAPTTNDVERRFDEWLNALDHSVSPFPLEVQLPVRIVNDALEFVRTSDDRPFFLWLSFPEPHNPYQVPEPYFSMFPVGEVPERGAGREALATKSDRWRWLGSLIEEKRPGYDEQWRRYRANYLGMLKLLDDQLSRFVSELAQQGKSERTLIVVVADHGDFVAEYGLQRKGVGLPECLIRIPMVFCGPGVRESVFETEFVSIADVFPTICEALDLPLPVGTQGRSLWPLLTGTASAPSAEFASVFAEVGYGGVPYLAKEHPALHFPYGGPTFDELNSVTQSGKLKMVRIEHWKLIADSVGNVELYDLDDDPFELNDLSDRPEYIDRKVVLLEELVRWTIRVEDDLPTGAYTPKSAPNNWWSLVVPSRHGHVDIAD